MEVISVKLCRSDLERTCYLMRRVLSYIKCIVLALVESIGEGGRFDSKLGNYVRVNSQRGVNEMSVDIKISWKYKFEIEDFGKPERLDDLKDGKVNIGGVYLWVRKDNDAIWYVGETNDYLTRLENHFISQIGGRYWIFNLKSKDTDWPGKDYYEPRQDKVFSYIASDTDLKDRCNRAYTMLQQSYFLFGVMDLSSRGETAGQCRKEAEGEILQFFYGKDGKDGYYARKSLANEKKLLAHISRNPTDAYKFCHIDHKDKDGIGHLEAICKFYSSQGHGKFLVNPSD